MHLFGQLYDNVDGSPKQNFARVIFIEAHSMIEISERIEIDKLKDKWISFKQTHVDRKVINDIPDHKIILCIEDYGINKLLRNRPIKCKMCLNKITCRHGYELNSSFKSIIAHSTLYIELRDEGDLIWPSRIVVILAGGIIIYFEFFEFFCITQNWS